MLVLKSVAVWLIFILIESINGTIRILWLAPHLGEGTAEAIAFLTGSLVVVAIAALFSPWLQASRTSQLLLIGVLWMGLTLAFEIALGRLAFGYSWAQIMAQFNLLNGELMLVELALLLLAPWIGAKIRGFPSETNANSE